MLVKQIGKRIMNNDPTTRSDLIHILSKLHSAQRGVERIENSGQNMRTIRQNLAFLIDGIVEWENYRKEDEK